MVVDESSRAVISSDPAENKKPSTQGLLKNKGVRVNYPLAFLFHLAGKTVHCNRVHLQWHPSRLQQQCKWESFKPCIICPPPLHRRSLLVPVPCFQNPIGHPGPCFSTQITFISAFLPPQLVLILMLLTRSWTVHWIRFLATKLKEIAIYSSFEVILSFQELRLGGSLVR